MGPNGIQKDGTVSEQWRLQWGYPPFRVDRGRLTGHIFGSLALGCKRVVTLRYRDETQAFKVQDRDETETFEVRNRDETFEV